MKSDFKIYDNYMKKLNGGKIYMHSQSFYKKIAIHESAELMRSVSFTAPDTSNSPTKTRSIFNPFLALAYALRFSAPLLVLVAALFCISCGGSSDFERAERSDAGAASDTYDPNGSDTSVDSPDGSSANPSVGDADPDGTSTADSSNTNNPFPIDFEPADSGPCSLPLNVSTTQANVESAPHGSSSPSNPDGGNCFLRITQMTSDGDVTVEFPNHVPISGTHLTFDVSFKDANQVGSSIMFLVGLADNDDTLAYAVNTLTMQPGGWYRVSVPIGDLLDIDLETGDGALSPGAKRFQIKAFNSSVGTNPQDQVSELNYDNITLTNSDQTAVIATPGSETDGDTDTEEVPEDTTDTIPDEIPPEDEGSEDAGSGVGNAQNFPVDFEHTDDDGNCILPENLTAIEAEVESAPYVDEPPPPQNPSGGSCFLRINQMTSDGIVTIQFPDYISLDGNFLTFDVSFGDENEIGAAIMFLINLLDDDDAFGYASNTVNMQPGAWYRVSIPFAGLLDTDPETGDGALSLGANALQMRAFNASVGNSPYDQVSELNFDNFNTTNDDQTGEL